MEAISTSLAREGISGSVGVGLRAPNQGVRPSEHDDRFQDIEQTSVAPDYPGRTAMRAGRGPLPLAPGRDPVGQGRRRRRVERHNWSSPTSPCQRSLPCPLRGPGRPGLGLIRRGGLQGPQRAEGGFRRGQQALGSSKVTGRASRGELGPRVTIKSGRGPDGPMIRAELGPSGRRVIAPGINNRDPSRSGRGPGKGRGQLPGTGCQDRDDPDGQETRGEGSAGRRPTSGDRRAATPSSSSRSSSRPNARPGGYRRSTRARASSC
jgi:hypothetical protein